MLGPCHPAGLPACTLGAVSGPLCLLGHAPGSSTEKWGLGWQGMHIGGGAFHKPCPDCDHGRTRMDQKALGSEGRCAGSIRSSVTCLQSWAGWTGEPLGPVTVPLTFQEGWDRS